MECGHVQTLFTTYSDRELPTQDLLHLEKHLATCPDCAREWFYFRETLRHLRTIELRPVPADLLPGIHAKLDKPRGLPRFIIRLFGPVPVTVTASLLTVLLSASIFFKIDFPGGQRPPADGRTVAETQSRSREGGDPAATMTRKPSAQVPFNHPVMPPRMAGGRLEPSLFSPPGIFPGRDSATDNSLTVSWLDYSTAANEQGFLWPGLCNRQIGQPLSPDMVIRLHAATPGGLRKIYSRVAEKENWQTRFRDDYFLVLINPEELAAFYQLLQQHHHSFFPNDPEDSQLTASKPLLIAVRP